MTGVTTTEQVLTAASELVGLAVLGATLAAVVALAYRWLTRERVQAGFAVLAGLAGVAVYLNLATALGEVIEGDIDTLEAALFNIAAFVFGTGGAVAGYRIGDTFGRDVINSRDEMAADEEMTELVKTVGRVTTVTMPEHVDKAVGYDPVSDQTEAAIAGSQFVFPRALTVEELDRRIRSRLKTDYGVGTVDMELSANGTVEHLAVGSRAAGIGPTLPSATNAVALRADPAFDASTGDVVQVWEPDSMHRVLTGELRGITGDIVTVAINSADTPKIDPTRTYRLVTLPVEDRPAREFASLLRAADESYATVTVEAGSPLHGMPAGALDVTLVAVSPEAGETTALPSREYVIEPGDELSVIGLPDTLRKLSDATAPLDPSLIPTTRADESVTSTQPSETGDTDQLDSTPPTVTGDDTAVPGTTAEPSPGTAGADDGMTPEDTGSSPDTEPAEAAQADSSSFDDLKSEYEDGDGWDDDEDEDEEPIERVVEPSDPIDPSIDDENTGDASFDDLKSEFDSGDAEWAASDDEPTRDDTESSQTAAESSDDLVSLDDADISFDEDDEETGSEDGGFGGLDGAFDDSDGSTTDDDITSLTVQENDDGLFEDDSLDDESLFDEDEADMFADQEDTFEEDDDSEDESADDDSEDESADDDSGGGSTFAQLKDEFESGDADWEDDISDSPGGDMRLDE